MSATHGVLVGLAVSRLLESPISRVIITNSIPADGRLDALKPKLTELCIGPLLGEAIHRIHHNLSVSALFKGTAGVKR